MKDVHDGDILLMNEIRKTTLLEIVRILGKNLLHIVIMTYSIMKLH